MSLSINDLQKDTVFLLDQVPHKVLDIKHKKMARQGATVEAKCRNLINKNNITRTFFPSDKFEEVEIVKKEMLFLYGNKNEYCFVDEADKSNRVMLKPEEVKGVDNYLLPNLKVTLEYCEDKVIGVGLPVKVDVEVVESPPDIRGNTAQGGTKNVVVSTGMVVKTPLFINKGDVIRINTQKGEYVERIKKV